MICMRNYIVDHVNKSKKWRDQQKFAGFYRNWIRCASSTMFNQIDEAMKYMVEQLVPKKVLAQVKRFLRRECRKPREMKVRNYFQKLLRINMEEIPNLPPFDPNQVLGNDELLDIVLFRNAQIVATRDGASRI